MIITLVQIYMCVCDTSNELSFDNEAFSDS